MSERTVDEIDALTDTAPPHSLVHVDLLDAVIPSAFVMGELERWADRLEGSLVRVRMVGVDPNHPALQHDR